MLDQYYYVFKLQHRAFNYLKQVWELERNTIPKENNPFDETVYMLLKYITKDKCIMDKESADSLVNNDFTNMMTSCFSNGFLPYLYLSIVLFFVTIVNPFNLYDRLINYMILCATNYYQQLINEGIILYQTGLINHPHTGAVHQWASWNFGIAHWFEIEYFVNAGASGYVFVDGIPVLFTMISVLIDHSLMELLCLTWIGPEIFWVWRFDSH